MRATLKSIARDLNVSHMTVSRALSGHPNVKAETRDLILARAHELGYVKSFAANAMRGDPTAIVGLLLPNIVNEFYARFANTLALLAVMPLRPVLVGQGDQSTVVDTCVSASVLKQQ